MRVLTGEYKGRVLRTAKGLSVRPATGRVRQTVFDVLSSRGVVDGSRVLDLFAGSGSLGIECLSRGATHATFVENDPEAARSIEENIRALGCADRADIVRMDAMVYVQGGCGPFDILFVDPPYRYPATQTIPEILFRNNAVAPGGYVLVEHTTEVRFGNTDRYSIETEKRFGRTVVTFFRHLPLHAKGAQ
jgi:16S rRNA (guanine966-N2)-methyltransferase